MRKAFHAKCAWGQNWHERRDHLVVRDSAAFEELEHKAMRLGVVAASNPFAFSQSTSAESTPIIERCIEHIAGERALLTLRSAAMELRTHDRPIGTSLNANRLCRRNPDKPFKTLWLKQRRTLFALGQSGAQLVASKTRRCTDL